MEERKARITRPALKEILHRDYEKCFKKVDGHYQDKATEDIYIIFLDGVSLGIDLTGRK